MPPKRGNGRGRDAVRGQEQQRPQMPGRDEQQQRLNIQEQHSPAGFRQLQQQFSLQRQVHSPADYRKQQPPLDREQYRLPPPPERRVQQPLSKVARERGDEDEGSQPPETKSTASRKAQIPITPEALGLHLEQHLTLSAPFQPRPDYGTKGRKIGLMVNYFPVELPCGYVYHYDVEIIPKRKYRGGSAESTKRNREVIHTILQAYDYFCGLKPAYDGQKNLYTKEPLSNAPFTITVEVDDEPHATQGDTQPRRDTFKVSIKPVQKKGTSNCAVSLDPLHELIEGKISQVPQEAIMAVEIILRNVPCFRYVPVGRSFFCPPESQQIHPLSGGREIWFGYLQSLRLGQWKPMINIDYTATTFHKRGPVIDYICEILHYSVAHLNQKSELKDAEIVILTKELKNLRIKVTHLNNSRKYRILKLTREAANILMCSNQEHGRTAKLTVSNYFMMKYGIKLRFPQLPCLQVNPEAKKVFLPLEVCEILEGQHCKKKMTERQTSDMIKVTARPPAERFREIQQIVRRADFSNDVYNRGFGIRVSTDPLQTDGRVIEAPNVRYHNDKRIMPRDGSWDMKNKQFFRGAEITAWVLLSYASERFCSRQALNKFCKMLCDIGQASGISLDRPVAVEMFGDCNVRVDATLQRVLKNIRDVKLAVIVLPDRNTPIYGKVKQAAETQLGLVTQCVIANNVARHCNPPLVRNLCQKINAKMGGVNNSLTPGETPAILRKPAIIIGAVITHPPPGYGLKPSLVASVGSLDAHPSRYAVSYRLQKHTDEGKKSIEIILELKDMVIELLKAFHRNTRGKKPEKIIFYRDGVSDGQFKTVRDHEIKAVRDACRHLSPDYEPGITFVVVQKRHHTRFMPRDYRDGVGRMKNIPPGTTVDREVTSSINFDFFLCSHFGIQGTSRPSHYTVLSDDNEFTSDDIQKLTYYLCHTYARCTRSISVPAPVAYAHLAAFRARKYLLIQTDESSASSQTFDVTEEELLSCQKTIEVMPYLKDTMYFV